MSKLKLPVQVGIFTQVCMGVPLQIPINVLASMIASLHDENGRVTIPGFYDKVVELTPAERTQINKAPFDLNAYKRDLSIDEIKGEKTYTTLERTGIRPTLDVNGIWGGYTGEGAKTVLPSKGFRKNFHAASSQSSQHGDYGIIYEALFRYRAVLCKS